MIEEEIIEVNHGRTSILRPGFYNTFILDVSQVTNSTDKQTSMSKNIRSTRASSKSSSSSKTHKNHTKNIEDDNYNNNDDVPVIIGNCNILGIIGIF
jgi:hypothetical protein